MKINLVVNPTAGRERKKSTIPLIEKVLKERGADYSVSISHHQGAAVELARRAAESGCQRVVAVGGDGTVCEVVNGIAGSQATLGIIPAGTGNDLARHLKIPNDIEAATRFLLDGPERRIDLPQLEQGRHFANVATTGFGVEVVKDSLENTKKYAGTLAYPVSIAKLLWTYKPRLCRLEADGQRIEKRVMILAIANGRAVGRGLFIAPRAEVDDGQFDVCIIEEMGSFDFLRMMIRISKGAHLDHPKVQYLRAREVTLRGEGPLTLETDGELSEHEVARFRLIPKGLRIIAPAS